MKTILLTATIGIALAAGNAYAAGDAAAGESKSAACAACHGADGNSTNPEWPKIAGQHPKYLEKQLKDFKGGRRVNAIMAGMAAPLSEQDMADLAAYYATKVTTGGFVSEAELPLGEKIYRGGNAKTGVPACMACHGPAGAGEPLAGFAALSGQHPKYIATQLYAFREGERSNDPKSMMRDVARWMTKQEIEAVSQYVAGLH
ncbi:MAG: cytochrome c4 [Gammaproteobacteria bacterium]|nr:cytochrome c4 [Gammaproteobacteria bacterium]MDH3412577.1 cytochrome c4 [Gammaproteobacteria bacterium]